ncbi:hypothetical protein Tco_0912290 [Tanacetum coccineum]
MQTQESKIDKGKALDDGLVVTESSGTKSKVQDVSSRSGNYTSVDDADIRPIYDEEPMTEVQLTAECNIFAIGQQQTEQPELNNEGGIQEKVFAIAALKNELRKSKGNSVDTKFVKPLVLGKLVLQPLKNQSVVKQPTASKSKSPKISKPRESACAKPNHVSATSSSRNSSKNMSGFSLNDMLHSHYLEEAKIKAQERNRNSKPSVMHIASPQSTTKGSIPKPRSNNQTSRSFPTSKSSFITITVVPIADHFKNSNYFLDSKHFVCSTC